jgi:hypothetical protein
MDGIHKRPMQCPRFEDEDHPDCRVCFAENVCGILKERLEDRKHLEGRVNLSCNTEQSVSAE